ncbi:MAG TPA: type II toxin-antitoxin system PemK/MazF family toxin [Steroidobacteraceae bacterium]|nr:type II toxin-antitoxin system PemK/MazF family toxin [Steroidobacteraceae bacterium]
MNRGDVCWYTFNAPDKRRPVLILTRDSAIGVLNAVTVAPITSTIRSIPTEVILTETDGLPNTCAANFDNLQTVPKSNIGAPIARLTSRKMKEAVAAISFALALDED